MNFIRFVPAYFERVWGGRNLEKFFNRNLNNSSPIGESWEICDREDLSSKITGGQFDSLTLRELLEKHSLYVLGSEKYSKMPFPILVKWLDCCENLSVQVHPPASVAKKLNAEPKSENWYFVKCQKDSKIFAGFNKKTSPEDFEKAITEAKAQDLLGALSTKENTSIYIPSGRVHAIGAGNVVLEIQQNSDTTYRVYDFDRIPPRTLHIKESLASIDFDDTTPTLLDCQKTSSTICDCEHFSIRVIHLKKGESITFNSNEQPRILSLTEGFLSSSSSEENPSSKILASENILLPFAAKNSFVAEITSTILVTENFYKNA